MHLLTWTFLSSIAALSISHAYGQSCHGTGAAAAAAAHTASPEYAIGTPKSFQLVDNGQLTVVPYVKLGKLAIYQGDLILGDADIIENAVQPIHSVPGTPSTGTGTLTPFANVLKRAQASKKWPSAAVPFKIDPGLPFEDTIRAAMAEWSSKTPIKFVEVTPENGSQYKNFVQFTQGTNANACLSSSVGMHGGKQRVELVSGCEFGQIVHEIGHVIGLEHEMTRHDRDKFVAIQVDNIMKGYESQFSPYSGDVDVGAYDYDSIMHYEPNAFSCNGSPTILPIANLPEGAVLGQRTHLSAGDIAAIKRIYQ